MTRLKWRRSRRDEGREEKEGEEAVGAGERERQTDRQRQRVWEEVY